MRLYLVLVVVLTGDASMRLYIVLVVVLTGDAKCCVSTSFCQALSVPHQPQVGALLRAA
jgi:hypothetical protein